MRDFHSVTGMAIYSNNQVTECFNTPPLREKQGTMQAHAVGATHLNLPVNRDHSVAFNIAKLDRKKFRQNRRQSGYEPCY